MNGYDELSMSIMEAGEKATVIPEIKTLDDLRFGSKADMEFLDLFSSESEKEDKLKEAV